MTDTLFFERVMHVVRNIPEGRIMTYADVAHAIGRRSYRAVGEALKRNRHGFWTDQQDVQRVPCHRVVAAQGNIGGFSQGIHKKIELLHDEGIAVEDGKIAGFAAKRFRITVRTSTRGCLRTARRLPPATT